MTELQGLNTYSATEQGGAGVEKVAERDAITSDTFDAALTSTQTTPSVEQDLDGAELALRPDGIGFSLEGQSYELLRDGIVLTGAGALSRGASARVVARAIASKVVTVAAVKAFVGAAVFLGIVGAFDGPSSELKERVQLQQALAEDYAASGFDVERGDLGLSDSVTGGEPEGIVSVSHQGITLLTWVSDVGRFVPNQELVEDGEGVDVPIETLKDRAEKRLADPNHPVGDPILVPEDDETPEAAVHLTQGGGLSVEQDGGRTIISDDPRGGLRFEVTAPDGQAETFHATLTDEGTTFTGENGDTVTILHDAEGNFTDGTGAPSTEAMVRLTSGGDGEDPDSYVTGYRQWLEARDANESEGAESSGGDDQPPNDPPSTSTSPTPDDDSDPEDEQGASNSERNQDAIERTQENTQPERTQQGGQPRTIRQRAIRAAQITLGVMGGVTVLAGGTDGIVNFGRFVSLLWSREGHNTAVDSITADADARREGLVSILRDTAFQELLGDNAAIGAITSFNDQLQAGDANTLNSVDVGALEKSVQETIGLNGKFRNIRTFLVSLYRSDIPARLEVPIPGIETDDLVSGEATDEEIIAAIDVLVVQERREILDLARPLLIIGHYGFTGPRLFEGVPPETLNIVVEDLTRGDETSMRELFREQALIHNQENPQRPVSIELPILDSDGNPIPLIEHDEATGFSYGREDLFSWSPDDRFAPPVA